MKKLKIRIIGVACVLVGLFATGIGIRMVITSADVQEPILYENEQDVVDERVSESTADIVIQDEDGSIREVNVEDKNQEKATQTEEEKEEDRKEDETEDATSAEKDAANDSESSTKTDGETD